MLSTSFSWQEYGIIINPLEDAYTNFGSELVLSSEGNIAAVVGYGRISIFEDKGGVWSQIGDTINSQPNSISLSEDGSIIAVGDGDNDKVIVYKNVNGTWENLGNEIIRPSLVNIQGRTLERSTAFGNSISLSNDGLTLAIGAYLHPHEYESTGWGTYLPFGNVEVYKFDGSEWKKYGDEIIPYPDIHETFTDKELKVRISEALFPEFGRKVSLSGDGKILAVSSPGENLKRGKVQVYKEESNKWVLDAEFTDDEQFDYFGSELVLSDDGNTLAISSNVFIGGKEEIEIYQRNNNIWSKVDKDIEAQTEDSDSSGQFALSLSADGSIVAIGDPNNYGNENWLQNWERGNVRIFENKNGKLIQIGEDIDGDQKRGRLGYDVWLSDKGNLIAIGEPWFDHLSWNGRRSVDFGKGRVKFFKLNYFTIDISSHEIHKIYNLNHIRDYSGNLHGNTESVSAATYTSYKYQGLFDVNGNGTREAIYTNKESGRWVTASINKNTGLVDYSDYGKGGTTRVVGIYIDPLVTSGEVEQFGPHDSQRRFQNDLKIDNLIAKTSGDYDGDGVHEVYWKTSDGSAYLRSLMHADGNIRYANYQSEDQMKEYLNTNGDGSVITDITS